MPGRLRWRNGQKRLKLLGKLSLDSGERHIADGLQPEGHPAAADRFLRPIGVNQRLSAAMIAQ